MEGISVKPAIQKYFKDAAIVLAVALSAGASRPVLGAEVPDYDIEINRLRKEITQAKLERQRLREDIERDRKEHVAYRERTAARKSEYIAETDSIRRLAASVERRKDSIDACIADIERKQKNCDLLKDRFRDHIIAACKNLMHAIGAFPPALSRPVVAALSFLINDCMAKNIDNIEALQRLAQIMRNLEDGTLSIQTGQETSAIPEIKGGASVLRIGAVFEALVDEDAKNAAVWVGSDSAAGEWRTVSDGASVGAISKAIAVRESKALPDFLLLPWGAPKILKETTK
jgi:hypothetical protein